MLIKSSSPWLQFIHSWIDTSFRMIMHEDTRHVSLLNASRNIPARPLYLASVVCTVPKSQPYLMMPNDLLAAKQLSNT